MDIYMMDIPSGYEVTVKMDPSENVDQFLDHLRKYGKVDSVIDIRNPNRTVFVPKRMTNRRPNGMHRVPTEVV